MSIPQSQQYQPQPQNHSAPADPGSPDASYPDTVPSMGPGANVPPSQAVAANAMNLLIRYGVARHTAMYLEMHQVILDVLNGNDDDISPYAAFVLKKISDIVFTKIIGDIVFDIMALRGDYASGIHTIVALAERVKRMTGFWDEENQGLQYNNQQGQEFAEYAELDGHDKHDEHDDEYDEYDESQEYDECYDDDDYQDDDGDKYDEGNAYYYDGEEFYED